LSEQQVSPNKRAIQMLDDDNDGKEVTEKGEPNGTIRQMRKSNLMLKHQSWPPRLMSL
jgi:hypothetical protein